MAFLQSEEKIKHGFQKFEKKTSEECELYLYSAPFTQICLKKYSAAMTSIHGPADEKNAPRMMLPLSYFMVCSG